MSISDNIKKGISNLLPKEFTAIENIHCKLYIANLLDWQGALDEMWDYLVEQKIIIRQVNCIRVV